MKVLFLDIDGVLNCESTKERIGPKGGIYNAFHGIDKRLATLYQDWINSKPVEVVLSSTWRLHDNLLEVLEEQGVIWNYKTPNMATRQIEIEDWLSKHSYKEFAILDDMAFFSGWLKPHFVQTSYIHGLRPKDLKKVEDILGLN